VEETQIVCFIFAANSQKWVSQQEKVVLFVVVEETI